MACSQGRASLSILACCICAVLLTVNLSAKDTTAKNDLNMNALKVFNEDVFKKTIIAHTLEPATGVIAKDSKDSLKKAKEFISKTINYLNEGNNGKALVNIYEALGICPPGEIRTQAIAKSYYALVQIRIGNNNSAVTSLNMCDSLFRKLGDLNLLAFHYNNLGVYYQKSKKDNVAQSWFNKSLLINRALGNEESVAINLNNLAKGDEPEKKKIAYLQEAIAINRKLGKTLAMASNFNNLASLYSSIGNYPEAIKYINQSYSIVKDAKSYDVLYENLKLQSNIYAIQGKYEKAYGAVSQMQQMEQANRENTAYMEQIIQNRIISKKEYELKIMEKESDIKRLNYSLVFAISLLVIIIVISLNIYYFVNSRRKLQLLESRQKIAEKGAEYAQAELINVASYLNTRNEILDNIQSTLSKSFKLPEKEMYSEIRKLNMYVKNLQTKNEEIDTVLSKITKINEGFIESLTEKHPGLTKNDKYIALLLRANLSTKQISVLMDCSPKSVNMARYRMRIHLNITSETNLVNYLKSL